MILFIKVEVCVSGQVHKFKGRGSSLKLAQVRSQTAYFIQSITVFTWLQNFKFFAVQVAASKCAMRWFDREAESKMKI